ncbi:MULTISPECIES: pyridoxal-phosphate dependent enzyme [unclassified Mesorhizobium]|uniref:threonine synthase n=1 Tax=unclassified Mesorhizobium TaxID=325217 RepID=UPI000FD4AF77|nr:MULTISPECIES: pyridoxal-phosphate dependent enzyme [unclassified Mesorhizobium]RUV06011.1 pyridoxal-phosphate dependent enzyme [Mesorhizobium sp. M1A.F.Ca.IN.020.03.2.1]RWG87124.1 MAG: pyridoxal-phosphate dependent enzyme [Mesorhizobium sp.]RWK18238.1 MAG: pyridoxal-phosphate dependent enzyme [Mesorhizobium sp.]
MAVKLNPHVAGMQCIRCDMLHSIDDYFEGCPACRDAGIPSSVAPHFAELPSSLEPGGISDWLSYPMASGLGEGNTPLSGIKRLADALGVGTLYTKNEFVNPAGSHKDRMATMIVQRALHIGASTVAVASTGNAGVSTAAYAARAGLECVVVTTPQITPNWRRALETHGARIIATAHPDDRWKLVREMARRGEWYPVTNYLTPPVGSNPFGVDGYRAIAFELYLQLGQAAPTDIVVPTSRGDLIWGIAKGYVDLQAAGLIRSLPRVHAVEPLPRIARALAGQGMTGSCPGSTSMVSISGDTVTYQSLKALEMTRSSAVAVTDAEVAADQALLGREGLYLERSSVAAFSGLRRLLAQCAVPRDARVVLLATSHGYKEEALYPAHLDAVDISEFAIDWSPSANIVARQ